VLLEFTSYFVNRRDDGVLDDVTEENLPLDRRLILTVPFRSFGPVVDVDDPSFFLGAVPDTHVLVLQYTGFYATGEVQTFLRWSRARNLAQFQEGLSHFDVGSQNWAYADADGNLAYFSSAEIPLRSDLENGAVVGLPPYFVRDGSGPNNWVADPARSQGQAIPFAVMPTDEMPHAVNPKNGFFVNANNDPAGTSLDNDPLNQHRPGKPSAIYYLSGGYDEGLRAGRITRLLRAKLDKGERISVGYLQKMQGNTQPLEAELLTPYLLTAYANAQRAGAPPELAALAADPRVQEAASRLAAWDHSTPTGVPEGYDAFDVRVDASSIVSRAEAAASVAATIENVWRAKLLKDVIDATLTRVGVPGVGSGDALKSVLHLLSRTPYTGVGASGVDFIPGPAALAATDRRDVAILTALQQALDALAGPDFAAAFQLSTRQDDYRWGRLHRITFDHRLGGSFSLPPAAGFHDLAPDLPGLARDGGYEIVNASGFSSKADNAGAFRFGGGPVRRYVGAAGLSRIDAARVVGFNVVAGGSSGVAGDPLEASQLLDWLTVNQHQVPMIPVEVESRTLKVERFEPAP
jgi:penicillin amidase